MDEQHTRIHSPRPTRLPGIRSFLTGPAIGVVAALALAGCNDDNDIVEPSPGFNMSLEPSEVTVAPGGTATVDVEIQRTGGFDGSVDITTEDLPDGVTAEDTTVGSAATNATLNLEADPTAQDTVATAQVRGSGTGVDDEVATLEVTVSEDNDVDEGISLSAEPDSLTVEQDGSADVTVTVERIDWEGAVTLSVDDFEDYVSFDPETVGAEETTSTMTISAPADADLGEHEITIIGAPDDEEVADAEVTVLVEVTEGT